MRMRKKPWAEDEIKNHPHLVIPNPEEWKGKWHDFFNNEHPIHIEVGTGKGGFLKEMAKAHPAINYIGIEIQSSVVGVSLRNIKQAALPNIVLLHYNALDLLNVFAPGEVHRIYINFSDPWPKKRHAKRRLTHPSFLEKFDHILDESGELHMKTDNEGLFEYSLNTFSDYGCRLQNITFNLHERNMEGNVMTEYEQKFAEQGLKIFRCEVLFPQKRGAF